MSLAILLAALALALVAGCSEEEKVASPTAGPDLLAVDKDGSEALGAPTLDLAGGSGISQGGISMIGVESAELPVTVPDGVAIRQVLLYWAGGTTAASGDDRISLEGTSVTGELIGGPTFFYEYGGSYYFSAYRADITGLGLVVPGANTLTVSNFDFRARLVDENDGVSIVVIWDDGSAAEIALRDGLDMAYFGYAGSLNSTVPQVFPVTPATVGRVANLVILAGSVGENRPNRIVVTTTAGDQVFDDPMGGFDGPQWDSLVLPVNLPAGASSITVELISPETYAPLGASLGWVCAALAVPAAAADAGPWTLSGAVFEDTDRDGVQGPNETGLPGVVVDLTGADSAQSATTDADGRYAFTVGGGSFTVAVDPLAHPEAFNADLGAYFMATSPLSIAVTTGPDATGNDFGFVPDADRILADLADGTITTDGFTRESWRLIFRCALHFSEMGNQEGEDGPGGSGHDGGTRHEDFNGHRLGDSCGCSDVNQLYYDAAELKAFLATIEGLFLPEPYQFNDGRELREAYRLLAQRQNTIEGRVLQELLVTELNYVVGRGAVGQADLVAAIAAWSESLLIWDATEGPQSGAQSGVDSADKGRATNDLGAVLIILEAVNTGGGGGVDE
jgi:hypothetical protein